MKKTKISIFIIMILMLINFSCKRANSSKSDSGNSDYDDTEVVGGWGFSGMGDDPDFGYGIDASLENPIRINSGNWTRTGWPGYLSSSDTEDTFEFWVSAGNTISVAMTPPSDADFHLVLRDENWNKVGEGVTTWILEEGVTETASYTASNSGYRTVSVFRASGYGYYDFSISGVGDYEFNCSLNITIENLDAEYNTSDQYYAIYLYKNEENDWSNMGRTDWSNGEYTSSSRFEIILAAKLWSSKRNISFRIVRRNKSESQTWDSSTYEVPDQASSYSITLSPSW